MTTAYTQLDTQTIKANAPDLLYLVGSDTSLKKESLIEGGEWKGPCPFCGGHDRFSVQPYHRPEPRWLCRTCTDGKWKDAIEYVERRDRVGFIEACQVLGADIPADPVERARRAADRAREEEQRLAESIRRAQIALAELKAARKWLEYYDHLDAHTRHLWHTRGIPDDFIDFWHLGYDPDHILWTGQAEHHTPTLTIPIYEQGWECVNIKHRILNPFREGDKYRYERHGLPTAWFMADPDLGLSGPTLLCEGEIKAAVSFVSLAGSMQVLGSPSKNIPQALLSKLDNCEPVYICLDPDAGKEAASTAKALGYDRCRIIDSVPGKIDDFILAYVPPAYRKHYLGWLMKTARRA